MRDLDWDGSRNLRDLGGLATPFSPTGVTLTGRVARGPRRELLTEAGWLAGTGWGLRSVVDLRSPEEVGPRGGEQPVQPPAHLAITLAPTEDQSHPEFRAACLPILDSPEYWAHNVRILPGHLRRALETIARSEPGVLVHCAAGRDRTGMVSALLLAHAGVGTDDVWADYAASVRAMAGGPPYGSAGMPDRQARWTPEQVAHWLEGVEAHVRDFAEDVTGVLDRLGVDDGTRRSLRSLLTGTDHRPAPSPTSWSPTS